MTTTYLAEIKFPNGPRGAKRYKAVTVVAFNKVDAEGYIRAKFPDTESVVLTDISHSVGLITPVRN